MIRTRATRYRTLILVLLALLALAACGSASSSSGDDSYRNDTGAATAATAAIAPAASADDAQHNDAAADAETGIDQTKLDVCATLPRDKIEAIIGPLAQAPKPSISVGREVGCEYGIDEGRRYAVVVYNLDRWQLIPQFIDVTLVPGLGDGAYLEHRSADGSNQLYVLARGRAVVSVGVNGADTPQLRQLLDLALASVR